MTDFKSEVYTGLDSAMKVFGVGVVVLATMVYDWR